MIDASYDKEFVFHDGKRAKNIVELASVIEKMPDSEFLQFVNPYKNDFANWINDILSDYESATLLRKTFTKDETLYIINNRISAIILEKKDPKPTLLVSKPDKTLSIMTTIFKKKDKKEIDKSDTPALAEPEKKPEAINYATHESHHILEKKDLSEHKIPEQVVFQHKNEIPPHIIHHHESKTEDGSDTSENMVWMVLYGLLIGLILILAMYRFLF